MGLLFGFHIPAPPSDRICLSTCETAWATCFTWAACIITTHAVSQTREGFLQLGNRTHLARSKRRLSQHSGVLISSRDPVWSSSFHFMWHNDCGFRLFSSAFLHPSDFIPEASLTALRPNMCSSPSVLSFAHDVRAFLSSASCCQRESLVTLYTMFKFRVSQQFGLCCLFG